MTKTAIFVEGQTELVFVRELLLKAFEYENISLECFTLYTESKFRPVEYPYTNPDAEFYFQIINAGSDASVLTRMLKRQKYMVNAGFTRIIGLRDMYSRQYRELSGGKMSMELNEKFRQGYLDQIKSTELMFFCFAIMEVEAWILGFDGCFERINNKLTVETIFTELEYALNTVDPENHFFHPANIVEEIFALAGENYNKSKGDINRILSCLEKQDFIQLYQANKCASFTEFCNCLSIQNLLTT